MEAEAEAAKQRAREADEQAVAARDLAKFNAWRTQLNAFRKTGEYSEAIRQLREMLDSDNPHVKRNRAVYQNAHDDLNRRAKEAQAGIPSAAISRDGTTVVARQSGRMHRGKAVVWKVDGRQAAFLDDGQQLPDQDSVDHVAVSRDGQLVATAGNGKISVGRPDGKAIGSIRAEAQVNSLEFSARSDGLWLLAATDDGIHFFEVDRDGIRRTGQKRFRGYRVLDVAMASKHDLLVFTMTNGKSWICGAGLLSADNGSVQLPGYQPLSLPRESRATPMRVALAADDSILAIQSDNGHVVLLASTGVSSGATLKEFPFRHGESLSSDGRNWKFQCHNEDVRDLALSSDATRLVTASRDATLRVWNVRRLANGFNVTPAFTGPEQNRLKGHGDTVTACSFVGTSNELIVSPARIGLCGYGT